MIEGLTKAIAVAKDCATYYGRGSDQFPGCQAVVNSLEGAKRRAEKAVADDPNAAFSKGWRHGGGYLCWGTVRVARMDFDTNPSEEFQKEMFDWIVNRLNE